MIPNIHLPASITYQPINLSTYQMPGAGVGCGQPDATIPTSAHTHTPTMQVWDAGRLIVAEVGGNDDCKSHEVPDRVIGAWC